MPRPVQRVAIVDATPMIRRGLRDFLRATPGLAPGFEAACPSEALALGARDQTDLIVSEVAFPGNVGIFEFLRELRERRWPIPVLVFSQLDECLMATRVLQAGALGYLMKSAAEPELRLAIERVLAGHAHLSRAMTDRALDGLVAAPRGASPQPSVGELSNRQLEVLQRVGAGQTSKEIAEALHISLKTVETHRAHIRAKLGLDHAAGLISYASRWRALAESGDGMNPPGAGI